MHSRPQPPGISQAHSETWALRLTAPNHRRVHFISALNLMDGTQPSGPVLGSGGSPEGLQAMMPQLSGGGPRWWRKAGAGGGPGSRVSAHGLCGQDGAGEVRVEPVLQGSRPALSSEQSAADELRGVRWHLGRAD